MYKKTMSWFEGTSNSEDDEDDEVKAAAVAVREKAAREKEEADANEVIKYLQLNEFGRKHLEDPDLTERKYLELLEALAMSSKCTVDRLYHFIRHNLAVAISCATVTGKSTGKTRVLVRNYPLKRISRDK